VGNSYCIKITALILLLTATVSGATTREIIDATVDGAGNPLDTPQGIAADGSGNVYLSGVLSDNAFKITAGGVITEFIDATGDGAGNPLDMPRGIVVDGAGNVYVSGALSDNAFKVPAALTPVELLSFEIE